MKTETAIMLPEDLLQTIDRLLGQLRQYKNRSEFIESILRLVIEHITRKEQNSSDIEIIGQRAEYLNQETLDALTYQVPL